MNRFNFFKNLEAIFHRAIANNNFIPALKTQELASKHTGTFDVTKLDQVIKQVKKLDKSDLKKLVKCLVKEIKKRSVKQPN